jgi:hypothetical protein
MRSLFTGTVEICHFGDEKEATEPAAEGTHLSEDAIVDRMGSFQGV